MNIPPAANALGTVGAVCWSIQLLPQIFINYRRHHTTGLQPSMMLLWATAGVPLGVYNIVSEFNVALRIQAQILTLLSLITWAQCYYYSKGWSALKCVGVVSMIAVLMGGIEAGLIFALRRAGQGGREHKPGNVVMAVLAAVLLGAGVLRHYWDIWTYRTVRGISFVFVGIDAAGDLFSLVSIVFQADIDILGIVIYGFELVLWIGVMLCGGYYNLIPWAKDRVSRGSNEVEAEPDQAITLHDMPSSTSVFRTPSAVVQRGAARTGQDGRPSGQPIDGD